MSVTITLFQTARVPFLLLTPLCVLLGIATAVASGAEVVTSSWILALIGGLSAHIAVNCLNEYQDFISGLDMITARTPFSGGSGGLPANPSAAKATLLAAIICLLVTVGIGVYFLNLVGPVIVPFGLLGITIIVAYTRWINRLPWVCLIAPGLSFGPLMVLGTHLVIAGNISELALVVSMVPFFMVNNLLLLNQYPDIDADKRIGRNHFPIYFGVTVSNWFFALFFVLSVTFILVGVFNFKLSKWTLLSLFPASLMTISLLGAIKYKHRIGAFPHFLALNVAANLMTPLVLSTSLLLTN